MKISRVLIFMVFNTTMVFFSFTKDIRLHNVTDTPVHAAIYHRPLLFDKPAVRKQPVVTIDSLGFGAVYRPGQELKATRYLAIAHTSDQLPEKIDKKQFDALCTIGVGAGTGGRIFDSFYVAEKKGKLKLYDPLSLKVSDIKETLMKNIQGAFDGYRISLAKHAPLVTENKHKDRVAQLRIGDQLCEQEQEYLALRKPKVHVALEQMLGAKLNGSYIPNIALVNSGGGARALISCIGFHLGAHKMGLLDALTYDVGLSGGSWFVALWIQSGKTIEQFKDWMRLLMQDDLLLSTATDAKLFSDALMVRFGLHQPMTLVNYWGALLANRYLSFYGDKRHQILWSNSAERIKDAAVPFPILAAASGYVPESFENRPKVPWYEYTPYEVGGVGNWLGNAFVPTWAFGRKFHHNASIDSSPELDLGGLMGICGSAFAFSFARGYDKKIKELPIIGSFTEYLLSKLHEDTQYAIGKKRFTVGKVHNFAKDVVASSVYGKRHLKMVDGGISFNLPYPVVSGHGPRKADILIFCDASSTIEYKGPTNLYMIERYAREHGLKLPKIDARRVAQKVISVFKDESDPAVPLVIYLPRIMGHDVSYPDTVPAGFSTAFKTSKFAYTLQEFDALCAVTQANVLASQERISAEILAHIKRNSGI